MNFAKARAKKILLDFCACRDARQVSSRNAPEQRTLPRRANHLTLIRIKSILSRPYVKNIYVPIFVKLWFSGVVPPRQEGRTRRHDRGAGCDGRGERASTRRAGCGQQRRVGLAPSWQVLSLQISDVGPSGPTRRDLQVTETQKPVSPGRARHSSLTPSRRECRLIRPNLW
jgi:hypothetical protein